jgi:hypothetical protein
MPLSEKDTIHQNFVALNLCISHDGNTDCKKLKCVRL